MIIVDMKPNEFSVFPKEKPSDWDSYPIETHVGALRAFDRVETLLSAPKEHTDSYLIESSARQLFDLIGGRRVPGSIRNKAVMSLKRLSQDLQVWPIKVLAAHLQSIEGERRFYLLGKLAGHFKGQWESSESSTDQSMEVEFLDDVLRHDGWRDYVRLLTSFQNLYVSDNRIEVPPSLIQFINRETTHFKIQEAHQEFISVVHASRSHTTYHAEAISETVSPSPAAVGGATQGQLYRIASWDGFEEALRHDPSLLLRSFKLAEYMLVDLRGGDPKRPIFSLEGPQYIPPLGSSYMKKEVFLGDVVLLDPIQGMPAFQAVEIAAGLGYVTTPQKVFDVIDDLDKLDHVLEKYPQLFSRGMRSARYLTIKPVPHKRGKVKLELTNNEALAKKGDYIARNSTTLLHLFAIESWQGSRAKKIVEMGVRRRAFASPKVNVVKKPLGLRP